MKKISVIVMAACMLAACQNGNDTSYTISGTFDSAAEGDSVELSLVKGRNFEQIAKVAVQNGKFQFKGTTDTCQIAMLLVGGRPMAQLFLESGAIKVDLSDDEASSAVGTPNNNRMEAFNTMVSDIQNEYMALSEKRKAEKMSEADSLDLIAQLAAIEAKYDETIKKQVADNADSQFGLYILKQNSYNFEAEELAPILEQYAANFPGNQDVARIKENNDKVLSTSAGKPFVDFTMNDPEGNAVSLSNFISKNKVTLVDFWASWCGPCRREMPAVKAAYEAYKDKGFGIVGVSLDNNEDSWKNAIENLGITWPQMSDVKGWSCEGAALYGVRAIPATVLIAQDGTILARDLRGESIAEKLAELLDK